MNSSAKKFLVLAPGASEGKSEEKSQLGGCDRTIEAPPFFMQSTKKQGKAGVMDSSHGCHPDFFKKRLHVTLIGQKSPWISAEYIK